MKGVAKVLEGGHGARAELYCPQHCLADCYSLHC
jgi:hypothetical protein